MEPKQKILIVDDNKSNLYALEKMLSGVDAEIIKAASGNESLIVSLNHELALAILDVQMPEMDGYELAELLRSAEKTQQLPIIFLSAVYSDEYHIFKGYDAGAVDYIVKPYEPKILANKVRVFLQLDKQKNELLQKIELEKSKNYLESILASISDSIIVASQDGCIRTVNNSALLTLGYNIDELTDMPVERLFDDDTVKSNIRILQAGNGSPDYIGKCFQNIETSVTSKIGANIPTLVSGSTLRSRAGTIEGIVLVIKDISERKQAERALRESEERYHQAESLAAIGQMVSVVAHEVRNPLQNIRMGMDSLKAVVGNDKECLDILEEMGYGIGMLGRTVEDLLQYSRATKLQCSPCSTRDVVEKALRTVSHRLQNINVHVDLDQEERRIWVDGVKLGTVLVNLFSNAVDAMPDGGELTISSRFCEKNDICALNLSVTDTGCGIKEENQEQVFKPFFTTKTRGTGLGLPACKKIIEAHKGELKISSTVNVGTKVEIRLPVTDEPANLHA